MGFQTVWCCRALLVILLMLPACSPKEKAAFSEDKWAKTVARTRARDLYAPHFTDGRFFAPWHPMPEKNFLDVLGWKLFEKTEYTDEEKQFLPRVIPDTARRLAAQKGNFILWVGHNTFLVRMAGTFWLTDPIFTRRALLPARVTPPALTLDELNQLVPHVNILISHNHYDHLDRASIKALPKDSPVFVPLGLKSLVSGMNKTRVVQMDWWETKDLGNGVVLTCLPAQHWSMRISQARNQSLWASWMLETPAATLYFGGDTGYFKGFAEIGKQFPSIDYAFLATTAYHPRWFMHYQHMDIPEALQGFEELGARFFIPTQWGTFHLGSEPPGFPGLDLKRQIRERGLDAARFKIMDIGGILPVNTR